MEFDFRTNRRWTVIINQLLKYIQFILGDIPGTAFLEYTYNEAKNQADVWLNIQAALHNSDQNYKRI